MDYQQIFQILLYVASIITFVIIINNTDNPVKALAYSVLVFAVPGLGIIFYFTLGVNYRKKKLYDSKLEFNNENAKIFEQRIENLKNYTDELVNTRIKKFTNTAHYKDENIYVMDKNDVKVLVNGEEKFPVVFEQLEKAKHHIHMEYYIYEIDDTGNKVAEILKRKAKEGVEVRLMYDDFGSRRLTKKFIKDLKDNGVQVFPFLKVRWILFANNINYRNHRKIIIIDGNIGFVGGLNVSNRYVNYPEYKNKYFWRDTHFMIKGPSVMSLQQCFISDWKFASNEELCIDKEYFPIDIKTYQSDGGNVPVQIVTSGPDTNYPNILYTYIDAILAAKKNIYITTPYFIPDKSYIDALKIAKLNGLEVIMIIPGVSDSDFTNAIARTYYIDLLKMGIKVYQYQKGFVHSKGMICDDYLSVGGSANLDQRSFDLNFEINAIIYDEEITRQMTEIYHNDLKDCEELTMEMVNNTSPIYKFIARVLRIFSPLM